MSAQHDTSTASVILKAPSDPDGFVYGTTVTNETAPVYSLIPDLAVIARHNPMGLAELFQHTVWDSLSSTTTERGHSTEVYGVGFLNDASEKKVRAFTDMGIESLAVDTYILYGSEVIFISHEIIGGRSFRELTDPTMASKYETWEYARYDLLNPLSWPDGRAIVAFNRSSEYVQRRKQYLREDSDPVLDFMG